MQHQIDMYRDEINRATRGGFAFPLAFGTTHLIAGLLTMVLSVEQAALVLLFQGIIATPLSYLIMRLTSTAQPANNPLNELGVYLASSQMPAIVAYIIVYNLNPYYLPVVFAMVGATHFVPYMWLQRSRVWLFLSMGMTVIPYALVWMYRQDSFYITPFAIGLMLISTGVWAYHESGKRLAIERAGHSTRMG